MPITYSYAALETTVQRGVRLAVDPFNRKSIQVYKDALIKALKTGIPVKDCVENAKSFDWKLRASEWVEVFKIDPVFDN
jgi:hypothetical protein